MLRSNDRKERAVVLCSCLLCKTSEQYLLDKLIGSIMFIDDEQHKEKEEEEEGRRIKGYEEE